MSDAFNFAIASALLMWVFQGFALCSYGSAPIPKIWRVTWAIAGGIWLAALARVVMA